MKKASLCLALLAAFFLAACIKGAGPQSRLDIGIFAPASGSTAQKPAQAQSQEGAQKQFNAENYPYKDQMLAMVNQTLADYASGTLPEPMRYNTDYSGITSPAPKDAPLPQNVSLQNLQMQLRYSPMTGADYLLVSLVLENSYSMSIHIDTSAANGQGQPQRVTGVYFYDKAGNHQKESVQAGRGGQFLNLKSDRLFASADFEALRTDAGLVSGSISVSKANGFIWVDIDSMKEPFFYTYYVAEQGGLVQDYPQKDWQRYTVINDDKMMIIASSLHRQFLDAILQMENISTAEGK